MSEAVETWEVTAVTQHNLLKKEVIQWEADNLGQCWD